MIRGIGVDTVSISEMRRISLAIGHGGMRHLFTAQELEDAPAQSDLLAEFLATRFAVKEAVFKAVAHLLEESCFDLRIVETRNRGDGSPYVNINEQLCRVLERAGVTDLFVSISTEGDLATAFVIAE